MKTIPPHGAFRIELGLSPMRLSCPIAGSRCLSSRSETTVLVTRP